MKKIMFNDRYGLTEAVLEGKKTMTRRLAPIVGDVNDINWGIDNNGNHCLTIEALSLEGLITEDIYPQYQVGDVVAIAQNYKDAGWNADILQEAYVKKPTLFPDLDEYEKLYGIIDLPFKYHKGWTNKMFVLADLMPHHIRIVDIKLERLQDISAEDCLREGLEHCPIHGRNQQAYFFYDERKGNEEQFISTNPKETFVHLIDRVSGKGTWKGNPWVFVYEFELID